MSISFMHHFHPEICPIKNISPSRDDMILSIDQTLIEVKAIKIKSHSANTKACKPNAKDWPGSEKEVEATARVIE